MGEALTFFEAARKVLSDAEKPLHYRDITERAIKDGFLKSQGKTPAESLNARICVDLKQNGDESTFIRTAPGVFSLRERAAQDDDTLPVDMDDDDNTLVRIPFFPSYSEVEAILPVWEGLTPEQITGLRRTIFNQSGTPQDTVDWSKPNEWIPSRLDGVHRELAFKIWRATSGKVNPRYTLGLWLLCSKYELLSPDADGVLRWTDRGRDFVANPRGESVRLVDEREGVFKLLSLVADRGQAQTSDIWEPWRAFLDSESNIRSDSYARSVLYRRVRNLLERGLLSKAGRVTSITEQGLLWLREAGSQVDTSGSDEEQDIQALAQQQRARVRTSLLEMLREMDPYAFEHLVATLLTAMGYDDVQVTAPSNDKGVDVAASIKLGISSVREVIQVKRQKSNIGRPVLDALRGSLHRFHAVRGTIISTGGFSKGTVKAAFEPGAAPITLMDGETLVDILMEHGIGVRRRPIVLWEIDPSSLTVDAGNDDSEA